MDTDIGPGTLDLRNNQLYHTDVEQEIGHHAPPFRVPADYLRTIRDTKLGDSPQERIIRHADEMIPVLNYFFASRRRTKHVERELAELFNRDSLQSGMAMFGRLFVPLDKNIAAKPTPYAPPEECVTPWAGHLAWTTEVSLGEGRHHAASVLTPGDKDLAQRTHGGDRPLDRRGALAHIRPAARPPPLSAFTVPCGR